MWTQVRPTRLYCCMVILSTTTTSYLTYPLQSIMVNLQPYMALPELLWAHHEIRAATTFLSLMLALPITLSILLPSVYYFIFHHITTLLLYVVTSIVIIRNIAQGGEYHEYKHLDGKVVLITGGGGGIGYRNAIQLARMNATVYIGLRGGKSRGEQVVQQVKQAAGLDSSNQNVQYIELDLMSFDSVRNAAAEFKSRSNQLDILLNNAGIMAVPHQLTNDRYEAQIQTNHLSHYLLTDLLIDRIKTSHGRIVNVSSLGHIIAYDGINYNQSSDASTYNNWHVYGETKLANILFTKALNDRYSADNIKSVALHPGSVRTELTRSLDSFSQFTAPYILWLLGKNAEQGSLTSLYCCVSDDIQSGEYYSDCTVAPTISIANSKQKRDELWEWSKIQVSK